MWLLDANLDLALVAFLRSENVSCEAAALLGWETLTNGELVSAAAEGGYTCLLTRDRRFAQSAASTLRERDDLAIVIVTLPQQQSDDYMAAFRKAWDSERINPVAGAILTWP